MTEREIFIAALHQGDAAERAALLDRACGEDRALRDRVEDLLREQGQLRSFLEEPAGDLLGKLAPRRPDEEPAVPEGPEATQPGPAAGDDDAGLDFLTPSDQPGSLGRLGHYEVQAVVGRGGMGVVLRAFDEQLHRVIAVKVMAPQLAASAAARRRFTREGRAAAAVVHEHVVAIHAVEEANGLPFLVMPYVAGKSLQDRLDRDGPLPLAEVLRIGQQVARGLAAAHAQGLVHRDVKPANILLENGVERVKLTDFGLARAADDASLTQSGVIAGTPMYMSPEQARGEAVDARSDLFSLGSVLYAMCAGRPPFRASSSMAVLKRVCEDEPTPIREVNAEAPDGLADVIAKLHAKDPAGRFQTAAEVAEALGGRLAELQRPSAGAAVVAGVVARPPDHVVARSPDRATTPAAARPRRWRRAALAAAVLACLFGGLGLTEATGVTRVAATVVRILTPDGTLVVQVDDPDVSVAIDGQDVVISGAGTREIRLRPGRYTVLARKDGKVVRQELVTVEKDGREVVRVEREAAPASDAAPVGAGDPDRRAAEYVLSVGGTVGVNGMGGPKAAADLPPGPFRLTAVNFRSNKHVTDAGLAHFQGCKNLTFLDLNGTQVGDEGLAHFQGCKNLKSLCLAGTRVSDAGLAHFQDCKNLTMLNLNDTQVGDEGLAHFQGCKNLTQLVLQRTQVGDEGLAYFQGCKNLTGLDLLGTQVGDEGLANFQGCKNLTILVLYGKRVTDAGLAHFQDCKNLTNLSLVGTQVGDEGLAYFKGCKNLTYLDLYGNTRVTDAGLACFQDCKNLTFLVLIDTQASDEGLAHLKDCKNLTCLDLHGSTRVTDAGLAYFQDCKNLTQLVLSGTQVSDEGLAHFQDCKNLTWLDLSGTRVTDAGLDHFQGCKKLTLLRLQKTKVTAAGIDALKKALPRCRIEWDGGVVVGVEWEAAPAVDAAPVGAGDPDRRAAEYVLSVGGGVQINDMRGGVTAAADLPPGPFRLTTVGLYDNKQVSDKGLASFQGCKNLTRLILRGTQVGDEGLANFKGCKNLMDLDLFRSTRVTDAGLAYFQGCKNLSTLNLLATPVTDAGLANFKGCKNLTYLGLEGTQVGDEGLANFKECKNLTGLDLIDTQVGDDGLANFQEWKNLTYLRLEGTGVTDAGLAHFQDCKKLTTLSVFATRVTDTGMAYFKDCKNLTYLTLINTQVGDEGLANFKECKNLTLLDLRGVRVTDAGLANFQGCKNLTGLILRGTLVGDEGLANFQGCKNLKTLWLIGTQVGDEGLANFQGCKNLTDLKLKNTKVTAAGIDALKKALPRCQIEWDCGVVVPQ